MSKLFKSKFLLVVVLVAVLVVAGSAFVGAKSAAADCSLGSVTLRVGSTGASVACLQAIVGATADGNFGPLTKASVMAWQSGHNLVADGVVGPLTKAAMGGVTPPVGGLCPNGNTLASNCTTGPGSVTGALCPNGNTVASNCASTGTAVSSNGEGSVTVTYDATPASNLVVNKGETKEVMGLKVKATGSDMKVTRLWLDVNTRIWLSASEASLWDGSTQLSVVPLNVDTVQEITTGTYWEVQFNGFNLTVPVGTTKVLTVKFTRPTLTQASAAATVQTTSSIRATDAAGFTNTYTLGTFIINLSGTGTATTGTLTASLNTNSPVAQSVSGLSTTSGTLTAVKLMDFDLKAVDGPINVSLISGTDSSTGTPENDMASLELRDGTNVLSSVAVTSADTFSFGSLNIDIPAGTTKTLSIYAKANHVATSYVVKGDGVGAVITAITATTNGFASSASITPTVTSNLQYLFQYAPTIALSGTPTAIQADGTVVGVDFRGIYSLAFSVTAPAGSDIYVNTPATIVGGSYPVAKTGSFGGTLASGTVVSGTSVYGSTLTTWDKVAAGTTKIFTVSAAIPEGTAGFAGVTMATNGINWTNLDSASGTIVQTWGLGDIKTPTVYLAT